MATEHLILSLSLKDGSILKVGDVFKTADGALTDGKIGMIFHRPESTLTFFDEEEIESAPAPVEGGEAAPAHEPETESVEVKQITPAHYEVWIVPNAGSEMERNDETLCRKVPTDMVRFCDEVWPYSRARAVIRERLSIKEAETEGEPALDPAPTP